jgi:signal recognition particle subunit SRP54
MGDIVSFVEKAQEQFDAEEARKLQRRFKRISLILMILFHR